MVDAVISELPPGVLEMHGAQYMRNAKGGFTPLESIRPADLLQDAMVRQLLAEAEALSAQIAAFKQKCFTEAASLQALLDERYGAKVGGEKGNATFATFDGTMRLQVAVSDVITFGPELQSAKALIDECLGEWAADTRAELRSLVSQAFGVEKEGQVNRAAIFMLLRTESTDARWLRALEAIKDSIRPASTRQYVRFHRKADPKARWEPVSLDAASA